MTIKKINKDYLDDIKKLYKEEGWILYLNDDEKLNSALKNSEIIGVFNDAKLIGFLRYLTDFEHILYVQDLIVTKGWRRDGIGEKLITNLLDKHQNIRSIILITDISDKVSNSFYKKIGFDKLENRGMVSYIK